MKGISTIIATILLVIITISLVGVAYLFVSGLLTGQTSKNIKLMEASGHIVIIQNIGTRNITPNDIRVLVNGEPRDIINPQTIKPGDAVALKFIPPNFGNEVISANVIVVGPSNSLNYKIDFIPHESKATSGTVGLWHFNEGSGSTTTDSSDNGYTGTLNGFDWTSTSGWANDCKFGSCLIFDGSNDFVEGSDFGILGSNEFTVEFWAKPGLMTTWNRLMGKDLFTGISHRGWVILRSQVIGQIQLVLFDGSNSVEQSSPFISYTIDEWAHSAFTFNSTYIRSYKNGVEVGPTAQVPIFFSPSTEPFRVGKSYASDFFKGTIDEVAIYNRALTREEILDSIYG